MAEQEWLECDDPIAMLEFLRDRVTNRKLRLFGCGCCRRLWPLLDDRSRRGVEASEQYADGGIDLATLRTCSEAAESAWNESAVTAHAIFDERGYGDYRANAAIHAADAAYRVMWNSSEHSGFDDAVETVHYAVCRMLDATHLLSETQVEGDLSSIFDRWDSHVVTEGAAASRLIVDLFGNPFCPTSFRSEWRTETVVALARHVYHSGEFDAMPVLGDALEDAGCSDGGLLSHLRGPGPHLRGCWTIDLILGKQ
jgi:hypothetical protein